VIPNIFPNASIYYKIRFKTALTKRQQIKETAKKNGKICRIFLTKKHPKIEEYS